MSTDKLAQALRDAISSLTYIANTACKRDEELMADAINVRGYARSRATAAEEALAAHSEEPPLNLSDRAVQKRLAAQWGFVEAEQAQAAPPAPRTLSPEEIDRIHDSIECWDGYGLGAKFNHQAFARAVLAAAGGATPPVAKEPT